MDLDVGGIHPASMIGKDTPAEKMESSGGSDDVHSNGDTERRVDEAFEEPHKESSAPSQSTPEGDEEEPVPLLERSPEMSGRRERKAVERFVQKPQSELKRARDVLEKDTGLKLGDCPIISHNITTGPPDDVRTLHQVIFSRPGRPYEFRRNLRGFRGFSFSEDSSSFAKKKENLERYRLPVLRSLSRVLDIDKSSKNSSREELALLVLHFLCDPKPSGREVKEKRKSRGRPKKVGKKPTHEQPTTDDEDAIEEAIESVLRGGAGGSDADGRKAKKSKAPKKTPQKTPAKKSAPKKRKNMESDEASSEDDEPLQKKAKKPPSDNEIKALVRQLLDGANLAEVTMKNILTRVYAKYPLHDLTPRKDFIKQTVKSLIS